MSEKKYPEKFYIIVGEDLRHEGNGQFSLMGINPAGMSAVVFENENMIPSIAVYCVLFDPSGSFEGRITIYDENEEAVVDAVVPVSSEVEEKTSKLLIAGKFMNVKFKKPGRFKVTIWLDDKPYSESFKIHLPNQGSIDEA